MCFYTVLIAALNIGLVAQLLRAACQAEILHLSKTQRAILVFFFALGTVHFTLAPYGMVWYTGQLIGFTCTLLAYWAAFSLRGSKAWFFTGLALAGAMLTRSQMVFTGIFPAVYLLTQEKPWNWKRVIRNLAWAALPLAAGLSFYLFYNQVRFGSPLDVGLAYQLASDFFRSDIERYGFFNLHYIPINFYYQYIFYPFPLRQESILGGSLFLLSPLFFGAFAAFWKPRKKIYRMGAASIHSCHQYPHNPMSRYRISSIRTPIYTRFYRSPAAAYRPGDRKMEADHSVCSGDHFFYSVFYWCQCIRLDSGKSGLISFQGENFED